MHAHIFTFSTDQKFCHFKFLEWRKVYSNMCSSMLLRRYRRIKCKRKDGSRACQ